jgi:hypothetical protein
MLKEQWHQRDWTIYPEIAAMAVLFEYSLYRDKSNQREPQSIKTVQAKGYARVLQLQ